MSLPTAIAYDLPRPAELPPARVRWRLDPGRCALLVHDMQRHFLRPFDAKTEPLSVAVPNVARLLRAARSAGVPVYYTAQPAEQSPQQRGLLTDFWGPGLVGDADAARIVDELAPAGDDVVLTKWRYDAFARSDLADRLQAGGRDQLVVTGVYGHIGCLTTATSAFMRDVQPFVVADALADFSRHDHDRTLDHVAGRCGVVIDTDAVLDAWTAGTGVADAPAAEESADPATPAASAEGVAPRTLEGVVADVAYVLEMRPDELTADTDLAVAGLDSLRAMALVDRWSDDHLEVDLFDVVTAATATDLLARLDELRAGRAAA